MKKSTYFITAIFAASLFACNQDVKEKKEEDASLPMQNEMHMENQNSEQKNLDDGATHTAPEFQNENLAKVYQQYAEVKTALVNSNSEKATGSAEELVRALQNIEEGTTAIEASQKIAQSNDLNTQRTAFSELSSNMESLLQGSLVSGAIYKQYCPMAFEGEGGYWLSSSEEIRNPYYGDKMLRCGSVRDTLQ